MSFTIKCPKCSHVNDESDICYSVGYAEPETCNDECYEFDLTCDSCGHEIYSGGGWGEFDIAGVIEEIEEHFSSDSEPN